MRLWDNARLVNRSRCANRLNVAAQVVLNVRCCALIHYAASLDLIVSKSWILPTLWWWKRYLLTSQLAIILAKVKSCEWSNHADDVRMFKISHDFDLLKITVLIDLISELLFLQRNTLDRVDLTIATASDLPDDAKCAAAEQLHHFEVLSRQWRAPHDHARICSVLVVTILPITSTLGLYSTVALDDLSLWASAISRIVKILRVASCGPMALLQNLLRYLLRCDSCLVVTGIHHTAAT